jgi:hypothetical protein
MHGLRTIPEFEVLGSELAAPLENAILERLVRSGHAFEIADSPLEGFPIVVILTV